MMNSKRNPQRSTLLTLILIICSSLVFGQTPDKPQKLLPNTPIEHQIKGGELTFFGWS